MRFTLYPIYWLADAVTGDEQFDLTQLPFRVIDGVTIETVAGRFREGTFDIHRESLGTKVIEKLEGVRHALVHRYDSQFTVEAGEFIAEHEHERRSNELVSQLAACLRLIRPMRQDALTIRGVIHEEDGSFDVTSFEIPPLHLIEVPDVQHLYQLRNQDCDDLKRYAAEFLRAMRGEYWKFRMAVQFHDLGHFQCLDWKARFLLWCSAIESIYTSHNREHQGSLVATSRIKWFLGETTPIYAPSDMPDWVRRPQFTVGQLVGDLYDMRNFEAHGDKIPDELFHEALRDGVNGPVKRPEVLSEVASFIIRTSLLKILRDGLLDHFADAGPAEAYFAAQNLTKSALRAARRAAQLPARPGAP